MTSPKPLSEDGEPQHSKWYEKTLYQVLLFVGGIALFVLVGGWILDLYIEPKTSGEKKDLVQALALITAGVAGAVGIYFTWRGQRIAREAQEENNRNTLEQLEQSRNELSINREGQITDRFTRAIDQLGATDGEGNKLFEIRLGGIYALERIARESEIDHWPIMEVLTAYVRQHSPLRPETSDEEHEAEPAVLSPDPDIESILSILRRRTRSMGHGESEPLNLGQTNLSGAEIGEANLTAAGFWKANLSYAFLEDANLSRASFISANLSDAALSRANLSGAFLSGADLSGADLSRADLSGADLSGAENLREVQLEETIGDENTRLPAGLKPPAHWGATTGEQVEES